MSKIQEDEVIDVPSQLLCPLTLEIIRDPVMTRYGHSFERTALLEWLFNGKGICPLTRRPLRLRDVVTHHALKAKIETWLSENGNEYNEFQSVKKRFSSSSLSPSSLSATAGSPREEGPVIIMPIPLRALSMLNNNNDNLIRNEESDMAANEIVAAETMGDDSYRTNNPHYRALIKRTFLRRIRKTVQRRQRE